MNGCEICPLLVEDTTNKDNILLQTEDWVVVLDRNQPYLGKSFVTARSHVATISELSADEWSDLHVVMKKMEEAIKSAFGADVINWECLMNNAIKAGQPTHVHWHLYPRYLDGTVFAGEEFPDPQWPRHLEGVEHLVSDTVFAAIAAKVREAIHGN